MGSKTKGETVKKVKRPEIREEESVVRSKDDKKKKKHGKDKIHDGKPGFVEQMVSHKSNESKFSQKKLDTLNAQRKELTGKIVGSSPRKSVTQVPVKRKCSDSDSESSSSVSSLAISLKKKKTASSNSDSESLSSGLDSEEELQPKKQVRNEARPGNAIIPKTVSNVNSTNLLQQKKLSRKNEKTKHLNAKATKVQKSIYTTSDSEEEPEKVEVVPDIPGQEIEHHAEVEVKDGKTNTDIFLEGWSKNDVFELINRIGSAIPKNDTLKYNSRVEKLDWEKVQFEPYSAEECKDKWKQIEKRLRGYRILEELLVDAKEWLEKPWTDFYRSGKKNRHPDLPKRPLTSYMLFYLEKKGKYAKKNPGLEMPSLSKLIAEKYKNLPDRKKEKYNALALNMREQYKEKMEKFLQDHPVEALRLSKNTQAKKPTGMPGPAKPVPPFKLFLEDKLKQHKSEPDFHSTEFTNECKNKWKIMSSKKKMPWIRWAHENEVKYLEELKLYKAENPSFQIPNYKSVLSKEEKTILDRMQGKPEKPPNSAYSLFSRVMLKDDAVKNRYDTPTGRMQEIARIWKELPKIDKDMYSEEAKRMMESYKMEYAAYLESLTEEQREEELASNVPKKRPKAEPTGRKATKKLKQARIKDILSATRAGEKEDDEEDDETPTTIQAREVFAREPAQPPKDPFTVFKEEYVKTGHSEKKAEKVWNTMSEAEKERFKIKLEELKQKYFVDYKLFLTSLNRKELNAYHMYSMNPMVSKQKDGEDSEDSEEDSDSSSSSSSDSDSDEKSNDGVQKKGENQKKDDSSDSSSSEEDSDSD